MKLPWSKSKRNPMVFEHPAFNDLSLSEMMDFYGEIMPAWVIQGMYEAMYYNFVRTLALFGEDKFDTALEATEVYFAAMEELFEMAPEDFKAYQDARTGKTASDIVAQVFKEFETEGRLPS